jgi:hypothetical protein
MIPVADVIQVIFYLTFQTGIHMKPESNIVTMNTYMCAVLILCSHLMSIPVADANAMWPMRNQIHWPSYTSILYYKL